MNPVVQAFFDPATWTVTYVIHGGPGTGCAIVDPVLDFDPKAARTGTASADKLLAFIADNALALQWILETHAHADHLSAASYLRERAGGKVAVGVAITTVQETFRGLFNLEAGFRTDGSQFDRLFGDGDAFQIGNLRARALATPGHTPACVAYHVGDAVFVGDTIFMPDVGTARCDFPGGSAQALYRSVRRLLDLPRETRIFVCHDYPPGSREPRWETTVAQQRARNIHIHDGVSEAQFVATRQARDATLDMPQLILPAIQVNIRAGRMPPAEANGTAYLKLPVNVL